MYKIGQHLAEAWGAVAAQTLQGQLPFPLQGLDPATQLS